MTHPLLDRLAAGPILADGAIGTMLYAAGASLDESFDALNLTRPELVLDAHRAYLDAGADLLETNSFGANRFKLEAFGLADRVREINKKAVRLAREAREISGRPVLVAGSIGPTGRTLAPFGVVTPEAVRAAFREQIEALLEGGVDLLVLETIGSLDEMTEAVGAAREACDLPIVASMTFAEDGRTIGGNCAGGGRGAAARAGRGRRSGPTARSDRSGCCRSSRRWSVTWASGTEPSRRSPACRTPAGRRMWRGASSTRPRRSTSPGSPGAPPRPGCASSAAAAARPRCTPRRCARRSMPGRRNGRGRLALAVDAQRRATRRRARILTAPELDLVPAEGPTRLREKLERGEFVVSVEIDPPKGLNPTKALDGACLLQEAGVDFINVADSPMARVRMSALTHLLPDPAPDRGRDDPALHDPRPLADGAAIGAAGGARGRGAQHHRPHRRPAQPRRLPRFLGGLRRRLDRADPGPGAAQRRRRLGRGVDRADGRVHHRLRRRSHAGRPRARGGAPAGEAGGGRARRHDAADLRPGLWTRFLEAYGVERLPVPVLVGILPLQSSKHAEFLHNEVPGITLSDEARERMRLAGPDGRREGVKMAQELLQELRPLVQGVYLMPSFGRYEVAAEVLDDPGTGAGGAPIGRPSDSF